MKLNPEALLSRDELRFVTLIFVDPVGQLRGKLYRKEKVLAALEADRGGFKMTTPALSLDYGDMIYDLPGLSDESANFGDIEAFVDPDSFWLLPWADPSQNVIGFLELGPENSAYCARSLCRKVLAQGAAAGRTPVFGMEWEFTLLRETPDSAADKNYANLRPATPISSFNLVQLQVSQQELYEDLANSAAAMGLDVDTWQEEMGPGFMETALSPSASILGVDQAALLKFLIKQRATSHGMMATFMARWSDTADGHGGHIHMSLTKDGDNIFTPEGEGAELYRNFIGGLQTYVPEFLPMFAPNVNSYRRMQPGAFAPIDTRWDWESRQSAFRAIGPAGMRVENRVPGADCNPYHAVAAMAAAGLRGIDEGLSPSAPGEIPEGPGMARDLGTAAERFRQSRAAREVFGETFTEYLAAFKQQQVAAISSQVTDIEKRILLDLA